MHDTDHNLMDFAKQFSCNNVMAGRYVQEKWTTHGHVPPRYTHKSNYGQLATAWGILFVKPMPYFALQLRHSGIEGRAEVWSANTPTSAAATFVAVHDSVIADASVDVRCRRMPDR